MSVAKQISYENNKKRIGDIMNGLIIAKEGNDYLVRTYWNAPDDVDGKIYLNTDIDLKLGEKVTIKIIDASAYDLIAEIII